MVNLELKLFELLKNKAAVKYEKGRNCGLFLFNDLFNYLIDFPGNLIINIH
jgi:hypothetical protein